MMRNRGRNTTSPTRGARSCSPRSGASSSGARPRSRFCRSGGTTSRGCAGYSSYGFSRGRWTRGSSRGVYGTSCSSWRWRRRCSSGRYAVCTWIGHGPPASSRQLERASTSPACWSRPDSSERGAHYGGRWLCSSPSSSYPSSYSTSCWGGRGASGGRSCC